MMAVQSSLKRSISERDNDIEEIQTINLKKIKTDSAKDGDILAEKMYKAYVKSALDALDNNDSMQIETLASQISLPITHTESISIPNFQITLNHLIENISKLDSPKTNNLIISILKFKWLKFKDNLYFLMTYSNFLSVLISSYPKWWNDVANKLVSEFIYSNTEQNHITLKYLLSIIPTSISILSNILIKYFPHKTGPKKQIINYINNLLTLNKYCSELRFQIWCLIIENCIKIDVELTNELDDLEEDIEEVNDDISDDDLDDDEENENDIEDVIEEASDNENDEEDENDMMDEEEYNVDSAQSISDLSSKLDGIMCLLFSHTKDAFSVDQLNNGNGIVLFNTLISLFKSHILSTHYTKSIQYLLFHISQQQPELSDSYLVTLIDIAFNHLETIEKRIKSLQYLSSYIARAKQLSRHQIIFVVSYLLGWLNKYVSEREMEINDGNGGMERFKLFYAAFQTLLYIFCFRHPILNKSNNHFDDLNNERHNELNPESTDSSDWECGIDSFFQRLIVSKFNPLKYCNETVVLIFARISQQQNVAYCFSIIDHNKRERLNGLGQSNVSSSATKANGNFIGKQDFLDLESYFPFDPIVLKKTKKTISENFIEWTEVDDEYDSDSNSDDFSDGAIDAIEHVRRFSTIDKETVDE